MNAPTTLPEDIGVLDVPCPHCGAEAGQGCRARTALNQRHGHAPRQKAAARRRRKASVAVSDYLDEVGADLGRAAADALYARRCERGDAAALALAADLLIQDML